MAAILVCDTITVGRLVFVPDPVWPQVGRAMWRCEFRPRRGAPVLKLGLSREMVRDSIGRKRASWVCWQLGRSFYQDGSRSPRRAVEKELARATRETALREAEFDGAWHRSNALAIGLQGDK